MSGLLNSNGTAPNDYIFISLGISGALILAIIMFYFLNKKLFKRNINRVIWTLIIAAIAFCLWVALYGVAWISAQYPSNSDDPYAEIDNNYLYTFYGLSIAPVLLFLMLSIVIALDQINYTYSEALFISVITGIIFYTILAISYYLTISVRDSNSFPLESSKIKGTNHLNENANNYYLGFIGAFFPITVISIFRLYQSLSNNPPELSLETERIIDSLTVFFSVVAILYTIVVLTFTSLPDDASPQNSYSVYLIITSFLILSFIFIGLITFGKTNFVERKNNSFYNWFVAICALISFSFSIANSVLVSNQQVSNINFTDNDARLSDGTKISDYNDQSYNLLNFAMGYNYLATGILSLILLCLVIFSGTGKRKELLNMSKFFTLEHKLTYNIYSLLLLVAVIGVTGLSIYLGIAYGENDKDAFKGYPTTKNGWFPLLTTWGVLLLTYLIEWFSNIGKPKDEESTFVLKIFNLLILAFIVIIPIVCISIYFITTPRFYGPVGDDSNKQDLVFGDVANNNAVPDIDQDEGNDSIFKVSSNFVSSGNGLLITGGRSSLDLETTRNIRYVNNQADYYNSKFLYRDFDFKEITNNGLNLFTLQTNQISYGSNDNNTDNAYWVAAGENVGLGICLFYNTTAGANSDQNIPEIEELNNWTVADSGAFGYKANGVISGISGNSNRWVTVGQNTVDFSDNLNIKYSNDGKNWTNASGVSFTGYGNKVAFGPSGLTTSSGLKTVNTYIAVGYDTNLTNNILRSTDGVNWTTTTNNFDDEAKDVAYGLSNVGTSAIWVAVGSDSSNPVKYSLDDGVTWNNASTSFDFSKPDDANTVAYNFTDKKFIVGGKRGNTNVVYTSFNGNNWTADTSYNNFDEVTSAGYNLINSRTAMDFDKVFYPFSQNQQFFVDKVESDSLKYFLIGNYAATFFLVLFTFLTMYLTTKDKYIN